ncbi:hypothetical protein [Amycolatopsis sp.]|uniref:hypothetical protein n=1 Tax=Amycolatopsis sp. TaxID=37632 RepID=UPI002DF8C5E5|nr:hypothetical protein [Amycolatopsis sp.]
MASSDFFVHTPGLDQNAGEYVQVAQNVSRLGQQVNSDTSGYDGVWGNDDAGKKFAPGYLTNKANFVEGVTALADVLQATSDGLLLMSKNFVKTEDHNTEVARKLAVDFKPSDGGGGEGGPPAASRRLAMKTVRGELRPAQARKFLAREASVPAVPAVPGVRMLAKVSNGPVDQEQIGSWASNQREWNSALLNTDQELRAEYARRGLEYPEPFGPPVQATPALRLAVSDGPPTQVELEQTAQILREADVRLQGVQERVLAAGEAIGWKFAVATPTISGAPLREDG